MLPNWMSCAVISASARRFWRNIRTPKKYKTCIDNAEVKWRCMTDGIRTGIYIDICMYVLALRQSCINKCVTTARHSYGSKCKKWEGSQEFPQHAERVPGHSCGSKCANWEVVQNGNRLASSSRSMRYGYYIAANLDTRIWVSITSWGNTLSGNCRRQTSLNGYSMNTATNSRVLRQYPKGDVGRTFLCRRMCTQTLSNSSCR